MWVQVQGVSHNFAEFPVVKACFLWDFFQWDKVKNLKLQESFSSTLLKVGWKYILWIKIYQQLDA